MNKHLQYLGYVVRHKWYTLKAARALGITWLGIIHDWSKFLPGEWFAYVNFFHGPHATARDETGYYDPVNHQDSDFKLAWLHHQKSNKHHWQYWLLQYDRGESWAVGEINAPDIGQVNLLYQNERFGHLYVYKELAILPSAEAIVNLLNLLPVALPMPDKYRREMLADWRGAGMAQGKPDTTAWYKENRDKIILHPETREWVEEELGL